MGCDMCGAAGQMYVTMVEGVEMSLCENCKVYGEVKRRIPTQKEAAQLAKAQKEAAEQRVSQRGSWERNQKPSRQSTETYEMVVNDFGRRIKQARERLGLKQEQLAKQLGMKESQLHKHETGAKRPDLTTARMLERELKITLVEAYVEDHKTTGSTSSGPLTIGDLLKK